MPDQSSCADLWEVEIACAPPRITVALTLAPEAISSALAAATSPTARAECPCSHILMRSARSALREFASPPLKSKTSFQLQTRLPTKQLSFDIARPFQLQM